MLIILVIFIYTNHPTWISPSLLTLLANFHDDLHRLTPRYTSSLHCNASRWSSPTFYTVSSSFLAIIYIIHMFIVHCAAFWPSWDYVKCAYAFTYKSEAIGAPDQTPKLILSNPFAWGLPCGLRVFEIIFNQQVLLLLKQNCLFHFLQFLPQMRSTIPNNFPLETIAIFNCHFSY